MFQREHHLAWNRSHFIYLHNTKPLLPHSSRPSVTEYFTLVRQTRHIVATSGDIATNGHTWYACNFLYMMVLMFGQSLMDTAITVIVIHTKIAPYYNVLHEAISYCFHGN